MEKQQFHKLQVGDLVEWNSTITTDPNNLGVVVQSMKFSSSLFQNGTELNTSFRQVKIKWSNYQFVGVYADDDERSIDLMTLIAEAKKI